MTYCTSAGDPDGIGHLASPDGNLGDALLMRCGVEIPFSDLSEPEQPRRVCSSCRTEDESEDYLSDSRDDSSDFGSGTA
jgi:hypothetical protein